MTTAFSSNSTAEQCFEPTFLSYFCELTLDKQKSQNQSYLFIAFDTIMILLFCYYLRVSVFKYKRLTLPNKFVDYDETYCIFTQRIIIVTQVMLFLAIILMTFEIAITLEGTSFANGQCNTIYDP